jgi:hypothetical protein
MVPVLVGLALLAYLVGLITRRSGRATRRERAELREWQREQDPFSEI